jgi:hypothetical protein
VAGQRPGVLHDGFDAQNPFAFSIDLQGELAEMDFEHRQITRRFLDQDSPVRRLALPFPVAGTLLALKQGLDLIQAEGSPIAFDERLKHLIHLPTRLEKQIPAVLPLVDRVVVTKVRPLLMFRVQGETEAGGANPTLADLGQAPYRPEFGQGLCDPHQACEAGSLREAVVFLAKGDPFLSRLAGHILVAIQQNLRIEGRVSTHLDGHVPPLPVQNVEVKVVDIRKRFRVCDLPDLALGAPLHLPDRRRGAGNQNREKASHLRMLREILPRQSVLPSSHRAEHHGNASGCGEGPNPSSETAGRAHQVGVIQSHVAALQQPPPSAASRVLSQRKVSVENDTVHTVVLTLEKIAVMIAELVRHGGRVIREYLVLRLPREGPLFLSEVSEKA